MSAAFLREAAALMRERAEAAARHTSSPWLAHPWTFGDPSDGPTCVRVIDGAEVMVAHFDYSEAGDEAATHIASWHPTVALTVADLIDTWLDGIEKAGGTDTDPQMWERPTPKRLVALSAAYLGRQP